MEWICIVYILIYIQLLIHELGHIVVALVIKLKIKSVNIGGDALKLKLKRVCISVLPIGGYVEVYEEQLMKLSRKKMILFFQGGNLFNLISSFLIGNTFSSLYARIFVWIGYMMVISNSMPFLKTNDLGNIIELVKVNRK